MLQKMLWMLQCCEKCCKTECSWWNPKAIFVWGFQQFAVSNDCPTRLFLFHLDNFLILKFEKTWKGKWFVFQGHSNFFKKLPLCVINFDTEINSQFSLFALTIFQILGHWLGFLKMHVGIVPTRNRDNSAASATWVVLVHAPMKKRNMECFQRRLLKALSANRWNSDCVILCTKCVDSHSCWKHLQRIGESVWIIMLWDILFADAGVGQFVRVYFLRVHVHNVPYQLGSRSSRSHSRHKDNH